MATLILNRFYLILSLFMARRGVKKASMSILRCGYYIYNGGNPGRHLCLVPPSYGPKQVEAGMEC